MLYKRADSSGKLLSRLAALPGFGQLMATFVAGCYGNGRRRAGNVGTAFALLAKGFDDHAI
jgi:hypothetical protein